MVANCVGSRKLYFRFSDFTKIFYHTKKHYFVGLFSYLDEVGSRNFRHPICRGSDETYQGYFPTHNDFEREDFLRIHSGNEDLVSGGETDKLF